MPYNLSVAKREERKGDDICRVSTNDNLSLFKTMKK
jgi:hypothetical protein